MMQLDGLFTGDSPYKGRFGGPALKFLVS